MKGRDLMEEPARRLELASVDFVERGRRVRERRTALGLSAQYLAQRAEVDRGRIPKIEKGDPHVRGSTWLAVEKALDDLERYAGKPADSEADEGQGPVKVTIQGSLGLTTIEGTADDVARLWKLFAAQEQEEPAPPKGDAPAVDPAVYQAIRKTGSLRKSRGTNKDTGTDQ